MSDHKTVHVEINLRMIESVKHFAEHDPKLSYQALMQLALSQELARIEIRMRALAKAARSRASEEAMRALQAIEVGEELP